MRAEGGHNGQFNNVSALLPHDRKGIAFYGVQLGCNAPAVGKTGFGEFDPALGAPEKFDAEKCFKAGDLAADGALSEREFLRSLGEAFVARGGLKADERGRAGNLAAHVRLPH